MCCTYIFQPVLHFIQVRQLSTRKRKQILGVKTYNWLRILILWLQIIISTWFDFDILISRFQADRIILFCLHYNITYIFGLIEIYQVGFKLNFLTIYTYIASI